MTRTSPDPPGTASAAPTVGQKSQGVNVAPLQVAHRWTILLGVLGIIPLCAIVQWLEVGAEEKGSLSAFAIPPVAIVILCGMVLSVLLARVFKQFSPRADLLLLYSMFLVAATICSSGLVRPIYTHISGVMDEYIVRGVGTVRPGYERQSPMVFPKLTIPPLTEAQNLQKANDRRLREEAERRYAPLTSYARGLKRQPGDVPPKREANQSLWDFENRSVQWWWDERFIKDNFAEFAQRPETPRSEAATQGLVARMGTMLGQHVADTHHLEKLPPGTPSIPWHIWAWPILNWSVFALMVIGFLICMAEVLRRLWLKIENLPMPLMEIPEGVLSWSPDGVKSRGGGFSWLLLVGLSIGLLWVSIQAAGYFRIAPFDRLPIDLASKDLAPAFKNPPFKFVGTCWICWSPLLIAIGCMVSLEISRSVWVVYWLLGIGLMILGTMGINANTLPTAAQIQAFSYRPFPWWEDQAAGAMIVMSLWMFWASRARLWDILSAMWKPVNEGQVGDAFVPAKLLPFLLVGLLIAMPVYAWCMGVTSILFLLMLFGLFILFTVAAARLRAETGFPIVPALTTMSRYNLMLGGPRTFGGMASSAGASFFWLSNSLISSLLPAQLEIIGMAQRQRVSVKRVALAMFLAAVVALAISMPLMLFLQYSLQGGAMPDPAGGVGGKESLYILYRFGGRHLDQGAFEWVRIWATLVGGALMLGFLFGRSFLLGFPFHPIALLAVLTAFNNGQYYNPQANINLIWGPAMIAWLIKRSIFKIGGADLFTRLLPLFRGVVIGHLLALVLWAFVRAIFCSDQNLSIFFTW